MRLARASMLRIHRCPFFASDSLSRPQPNRNVSGSSWTRTGLCVACLWTGRHGAQARALLASTPRRLTARACRSSKSTQRRNPSVARFQTLIQTPVSRGRRRVGPRSGGRQPLRHSAKEKTGNRCWPRNSVFCCAQVPGPEKTRSSPRAAFSREGFLGLTLGLGTTDSHALSNTWESVQKTGQPENGVVF